MNSSADQVATVYSRYLAEVAIQWKLPPADRRFEKMASLLTERYASGQVNAFENELKGTILVSARGITLESYHEVGVEAERVEIETCEVDERNIVEAESKGPFLDVGGERSRRRIVGILIGSQWRIDSVSPSKGPC